MSFRFTDFVIEMNDGSESSIPSMLTEFSSSELLENTEQLDSPEKMPRDERAKLKNRMLMKKLALSDNCAPRLANADNYVDIGAKEDEERELNWLNGRFPPSHPTKSALMSAQFSTSSCVIQRKMQKSEIMQKLSNNRRQAQEKRKQLYAQDNEELLDEMYGEEEKDEEEENEDEEEKEDHEHMEDEEEKDQEDTGDDEDMEDEEEKEDQEETVDQDNEDGEKNWQKISDDLNCNKLSTMDDRVGKFGEEDFLNKEDILLKKSNAALSNVKIAENSSSVSSPLALPDSLSQWFNRSADRLHELPMVNKGILDEFIVVNDLGGNDTLSQSDLLSLCSGQFVSQSSGKPHSYNGKEEEEDDDVVLHRKRKELFCDEDEREEGDESNDGDEYEEGVRDQPQQALTRVMIDSDDDSVQSEEDEENAQGAEQVDSDDEMAVFRNQEKERERRRDWVEEEAELSGDDVGSDGEDEDYDDHYEAEEGDLDVVPDDEVLRADLHKQLMKQQESSDHRELIQLRERLLGDDLNGVKTNRTFRLKLRDNEDGIEEDDNIGEKEDEDEAEDDINFEVIKKRMEIENEEEAGKRDDEINAIDVFSTIARSTTLSNRSGVRVRASLLHIDSSKIFGNEITNVKEKKKTFFISKDKKDNENSNECVEALPVKRKCVLEPEKPTIKKYKPSLLQTSSVFSKFE
ncbi:clsp-1 [Pristionchus pacificus]|nr:clsp-1 [Pristionchus pacificus]